MSDKKVDNYPKTIPLSFKSTEDDIQLYKWLKSKSSASGFIKDILRKAMEKESNNK